MASRWREREVKRPSSWRQALLFNSILILLPLLAFQIIKGAYTSDVATNPMSIEALTETRSQIDQKLTDLSGPRGNERAFWAGKIEERLQERDFSAARGYLLAAPMMLDRQDTAAVLAAADAEQTGTKDQRLARAALLFLPDETRASYQRAIAPPSLPEPEVEPESSTDEPPQPQPEPTTEPAVSPSLAAIEEISTNSSARDPFSSDRAFFLLGDPADLTRRSQRWLAGEAVDSLQLRIRALGLMMQRAETTEAKAFVKASSVLRAAHRSGRLSERFARYIESRIDDALPEDILRAELALAFEPVMTTEQRSEMIFAAYSNALQGEALSRLSRDMTIIARLADLTSSTGAMTLVEQASTPEDMRRAQLVAEAGGDRSVTLAREIGPEVLDLAQIGVKWSMNLVLQVMALMALGMALIWTTLSALTQAETIRHRKA
jgi:hypothetical protein